MKTNRACISTEILLTPEQIRGKSSPGHEAFYVLDDDPNTYYQTPEISSNSDFMRFLDIDLYGVYDISQITLYMLADSYNHYQIYASETGDAYRKIAAKTDDTVSDAENGDCIVFNVPVRASCLRINLSYNSVGMQGNLSRLKLFGTKISDRAPLEPNGIQVQDFADTEWKKEWDRFEQDPVYARNKTLCEMRNMVGRVIGEAWKSLFLFDFLTAERDTFEVENGENGTIVIRGTNGIAMASGLHYYLRYFCNVDYSPLFVSNLCMPETLPRVPEKIVREIPYQVRYGFHVCSHSYTMPFWEWEKYEACLDWAAMCGVNLILHVAGQEEIIRRMLTKFGYTDTEVKEYLTGPTYFTWGCRNMSGFGGPLPDNWFADRVELGRRIHDRMQVFGMKPLLRGYFGAVPNDFTEKNPDAQVIHQGTWCAFTRPDVLRAYVDDGCRDLYAEVSDAFYEAQRALFGDVTDYYSADPFIEGGAGGDIDQAKMFRTIHSKMLEHNPDSIWVMQKWGESLNNTRMAGLVRKDNVLVLNINSEISCDTELSERNQIPWLWGLLHEFGGKQGLEAHTRAVVDIPKTKKNTQYMAGIGMTSESFARCPMIYELLWDVAWTKEPVDLMTWGMGYMKRRYGKVNEDLARAWSLLLDTVYCCEAPDIAESLILSRPTEQFTSACAYARGNITYDVEVLEEVLEIYINNYAQFGDSPCYRYDMVDIARQVLSNASLQYHKRMMDAYYAKDADEFEKESARFLNLIQLQNDILDTSDDFQVGSWIASARNMRSAQDDWTRDMFEWNARCLISTWGGKRSGDLGMLRDYANRAWAGMIRDYYYKRWAMWIENYKTALIKQSIPEGIDWFQFEWEWANRKSDEGYSYPERSISQKELLALAKEAYLYTSAASLRKTDTVGADSRRCNLLLGKRMDTINHLTEDELRSLTDGDIATGWTGTPTDWPLIFTCDFQGRTVSAEEIRISIKPLVASGIPVSCKVELFKEGMWHVFHEDDSGNASGQIVIPCRQRVQQVRLVLNSTSEDVIPELREISILGIYE